MSTSGRARTRASWVGPATGQVGADKVRVVLVDVCCHAFLEGRDQVTGFPRAGLSCCVDPTWIHCSHSVCKALEKSFLTNLETQVYVEPFSRKMDSKISRPAIKSSE